MKKVFLLLMTVSVLTVVLWLKASAAGAAPIKVSGYSEIFMDAKPGERVPAKMSVSDTVWQDIDCVTTEQPGFVTCQFEEKYAGQQVTIEFTRNDAMHIYFVNVPGQ